MSKLMISVSGIRGVFGESLTPETALKYAAHYGVFCQRGKIVVGRDSRTTGIAMLHAVMAGLISVGCEVVDLGIVSTPTVLLAVEESDASGGIAITASHNPAQWNAMKFVASNGMFLFPENAKTFIDNLDNAVPYADWKSMGKVTTDAEAIDRHIKKILDISYLNIESIKAKKYKVVIDCVNGAGGLIVPKLLEKLGCEIIELNCEPTGVFAHVAEPLNENLTQLEARVRETGADIGFATDPDVDRLSIVSEKGYCLGEEFTLLLSEKFVLAKKKGDIVTNLSSSMASEDIATAFGVQVHRTKVGEINVGKLMQEIKSPIGGEGNGGVICPEVHYTRDAPVGIALILAYMAQEDKPVSELAEAIPHYYFAKEKLEVHASELDQIMLNTEIAFSNEKIDRTDGFKVLGDKYWIHIRKSGTEPIIRVYCEAETAEKAAAICKDTIAKIRG